MMISHFLTGLTICTDKHSNIIQLTHNSVPQLIFLDIRNFTSCHQTIFRFVVSRDDDSTYLCHIIIVWAQILDIIISLLWGSSRHTTPKLTWGNGITNWLSDSWMSTLKLLPMDTCCLACLRLTTSLQLNNVLKQ